MSTSSPPGQGNTRDLGQAMTSAELSDVAIQTMWSELTGWDPEVRPDAWEATEDGILGVLDPDVGLHVRPGGWTIDLGNTVARTAVAAALIGGTMWPAGLDQLPGYILPAVLPLLFDVTRSRLTRHQESLLVELRLSMTVQDLAYPWPAAALYHRLPASVQAQVAPADFDAFVDQLVRVGVADSAGYDEVRIRPADRPAWLRISVR